ncbi:CDP-4-dehydro-6-deoxyglucose reductase protein [Halorhabdus tiamatea SARL4B]|uniref:CDP-4-dehydro-6-deoxyglucose reductase protein n=1 Tax=Halorhabdus tiamatea SARL4B TaxID=1033806 RepID=F7PN88_9EURY|nr:FAD-binding oxidoreductase [Halorhabdus tiamatea]ERJ07793.1 CDP-4-dehydro-6-deoxyglucose reductase protein [Halorhabdus tiamatea SARL4B]CCQ32549.1 phenol hydroxylase, FAD-and [2Fe-2S]-containing reductase component DmpP [Halorhabdus tiamatea SARL4B]
MDAQVRDHASQHDAIADLPLITESARVRRVTKMDQDRRPEVTRAINRWVAEVTPAYTPIEGPADWDGLRERLLADGHPDVARRVATLAQRYDRPKPMLARVELNTESAVDFVAGQYIGLRYDGTSRAYSLASSPTRDTLEICVRRVPGGRLSPRICDDLAVGDEVTVRGPYGELVLQDSSPRDVVFLATGTGVAPLKSMIDYLFETGRDEYQGEKRDVWLFLGAAWADDLPYRTAFRRLARERDNFHFVPCLSREPYLSDWDGETAYVQHALLKHIDETAVSTPMGTLIDDRLEDEPASDESPSIDPGNVDVYACGINAMVYSLVAAVERLGVPANRIESEGFG